ncbi:MAG: PhzF family phenazine biosynthesis protein [Holosporales bacterium]|jgi:predicted PhzF superfamily epimerase YddE/YHI9|nr:PhzF family phenazine biosynthesis protein [Holosporales bacterium]
MTQVKRPLWLIDAFTQTPFKGNPAGVCLVDSFPDDSTMQKIAFELHWSETSFIHRVGDSPNRFRIRWFSPLDEAPICGHATLAAMHFLCESSVVRGGSAVFESRVGELYLRRKKGKISMDFPASQLTLCTDSALHRRLAQVLGTKNILAVHRDALVYVVILETEFDVWSCVPDLEEMKKLDCRAVTITANASDYSLLRPDKFPNDAPYSAEAIVSSGWSGCDRNYDFVSRYFAPKVGIPEDPVCGSSHCRLAPLWARISHNKRMRARQLSKRGGYVDIWYDESRNIVEISGEAVTVLKGEIYV